MKVAVVVTLVAVILMLSNVEGRPRAKGEDSFFFFFLFRYLNLMQVFVDLILSGVCLSACLPASLPLSLSLSRHEERPGMSDVPPTLLSGFSGLSFDVSFLSPLSLSCLVLFLFLS